MQRSFNSSGCLVRHTRSFRMHSLDGVSATPKTNYHHHRVILRQDGQLLTIELSYIVHIWDCWTAPHNSSPLYTKSKGIRPSYCQPCTCLAAMYHYQQHSKHDFMYAKIDMYSHAFQWHLEIDVLSHECWIGQHYKWHLCRADIGCHTALYYRPQSGCHENGQKRLKNINQALRNKYTQWTTDIGSDWISWPQ